MLGPTLPVVEDGRGSLDFNATLDPTENVTIAFSATNLLGAAATNHRQYVTLWCKTQPFEDCHRIDRKSTRLNSSHSCASRMPSSACKTNNHTHYPRHI